MGELNEKKSYFYSVRCVGCQDQAVIEAPDEEMAEALWLKYKPCGCKSGVEALSQEKSYGDEKSMRRKLQDGD